VTPGSTLPLASVTVPAIVARGRHRKGITSAIHSAKQQVDRVINASITGVEGG
jgi:hypothetical protein